MNFQLAINQFKLRLMFFSLSFLPPANKLSLPPPTRFSRIARAQGDKVRIPSFRWFVNSYSFPRPTRRRPTLIHARPHMVLRFVSRPGFDHTPPFDSARGGFCVQGTGKHGLWRLFLTRFSQAHHCSQTRTDIRGHYRSHPSHMQVLASHRTPYWVRSSFSSFASTEV